jgi:hypothetical protein
VQVGYIAHHELARRYRTLERGRGAQPKRPGRKPGSGTFSFRQAPRPEEIMELPVPVATKSEESILIWL